MKSDQGIKGAYSYGFLSHKMWRIGDFTSDKILICNYSSQNINITNNVINLPVFSSYFLRTSLTHDPKLIAFLSTLDYYSIKSIT